MRPRNTPPRPVHRYLSLGWLRRHVWPLTIALLCFIYAFVELFELWGTFHDSYSLQHQNFDVRTVVGHMNTQFKHQVDNLQGKDTGTLAGEFGYFLETRNCPFIFRCESVDALPRNATLQQRMENATKTPPVLFVPWSPIPIPTWHTIAGTPRALWYTAQQIAAAGYWAIAVFLSCTLLWLAMLIRAARSDTLIVGYLMSVGAPLGIGLMVTLTQWLCQAALKSLDAAGCAVVVVFMAILHGTALALLVGLNHISKAPAEIAEGIEKLKVV